MRWTRLADDVRDAQAMANERRRRELVVADEGLVARLAAIIRDAPRAPAGAALAYARSGRTIQSDTDPLIRAQRVSGKSDEDRRESIRYRGRDYPLDYLEHSPDRAFVRVDDASILLNPNDMSQAEIDAEIAAGIENDPDRGIGFGDVISGARESMSPRARAANRATIGSGFSRAAGVIATGLQGHPDAPDPGYQPTRRVANRVVQAGAAVAEDALGLIDVGAARYDATIPDLGPRPRDAYYDYTQAPVSTDLFPLTRESLAGRGGEGYFVQGEGRANAVALQKKTRGTVGDHAGTLGRWTATRFVDPDTEAFDFISGSVDVYKAVALDPTNTIVGGATSLNRARKTFELADAGAYQGVRKLTHGPTVNQYLSSQQWGDTAGYLAREDDFLTLWEKTGGQYGAETTAAMIRTTDPTQVTDLAREKLGLSIRQVPRLKSNFRQTWEPPRAFRTMPEPQFHWEDTDTAVKVANEFLANAKVGRAERSRQMLKVAEAAGDRTGTFDAFYGPDGVLSAVNRQLVTEYQVPVNVADELTRAISKDVQATGRYYAKIDGDKIHPGGFTVDGEFIPIPGPGMEAELLNNVIVLPDVRAIRRRASMFYVAGGEKAAKGVAGLAIFADVINGVFKPLALITRLAYPVRLMSELQVRMAADGLDSVANHPFGAMAWIVGNSKRNRNYWGKRTGLTDLLDDPFTPSNVDFNEWEDVSKPLQQALSSGGERFRVAPHRAVADARTTIRRTDPDFADAVGHEIGKMANGSPVFRETARALSFDDYSPAGIGRYSPGAETTLGPSTHNRQVSLDRGPDAVKEWFFQGAGQQERIAIAKSDARYATMAGNDAAARAASDSFVDDYVLDRLLTTTGGDPKLIEAVATGQLDGTSLYVGSASRKSRLDPTFRQYLDEWAAGEQAPDLVLGTRNITLGRALKEGDVEHVSEGLKTAMGYMFDLLAARPENYLARHPTYRQYFFNRALELSPYASKDDVGKWVKWAEDNNMGGAYIGKLRAAAGTSESTLPIEVLNKEAAIFAGRATNDLLWEKAARMQFFDMARFLFPFGDAWSEVIKSWAKLTYRNPRILRRGQQVVQGARGAGFFYTSPDTGQEVFAIPQSSWVNEKVAGIPNTLEVPVQSLNVGLSPLPGVGPAIAGQVDRVIPNRPEWDAFRETVLPYGVREADGPWDWFIPSYWQKIRAAGKFPFLKPTQEQIEQRKQNIDYAATYLMSEGGYDQSSAESMRQLMDDAEDAADKLMLVRGIVQSTSPGPPSWNWKVRVTDVDLELTEDGETVKVDKKAGQRLADLRVLGDYYRALQESYDYESGAAVEFLETFGPDLAMVMQPTTRTSVYGLPSGEDAYRWLQDNPSIPDDFPTVYGLFAPDGGEFDMRAYRFTERRGEREEISGDEFWRRSNHRVADAIYGQARDAVGPNPDEEQRKLLAALRGELSEQFAEWDHPSINVSKPFLDGSEGAEQFVDEFRRAVEDERLADTDTAAAIRDYLKVRDAVKDKYGGSGWSTATKAAPLRAALRGAGALLVEKYPSFAPAWDQVFSREGNLDDEAELEETG